METEKGRRLTRREFAQRAAVFSAAAPLASTGFLPDEVLLQTPAQPQPAQPQQQAENLPKLSPEGQIEVDARYQEILAQYGSRFSADEKTMIRTLCIFLQPALEKVRAYPLTNGDAPALCLKPLVEREKKPATAPPAKTPPLKTAKPAPKKS